MKTDFLRKEEGQVLVQVTVSLVVLLIFVGLAIDGGLVYGERRRMQNAADAAALAGAYELCRLSTVDVARAKAIEYLKKNGVPDATAIDANIAISGGKVTATAKKSSKTYISSFAGFSTIDVGAYATAACGAATSACGLWPMAFSVGLWNENLKCGEQFIVWAAESDGSDAAICKDSGGTSHPLCDCYQCDLNKDGTDDFRIVTDVSRGWLDYSDLIQDPYVDTCQANGCGASELACRIRKDSAAKITLPACIPGIRGVKAGVKDDVTARVGQPISIALYDTTGCTASSNCSGTDAATYHVTKFGCVTIDAWEQNFELTLKTSPPFTLPPNGPDKLPNKIKSKVIKVSRRCDGACTTACGSTDGTVPAAWEVTATSLIK